MIFAYARVSTEDQKTDRQVEAIKKYEPNISDGNIYLDKASGKDFEREKYKRLKEVLRSGDVLIIKELDRLGRNKESIKRELEYFIENGVRVKILDIPTTLSDLPKESSWVIEMVNNILIEVLSSIAQEERSKIRARQKEGIKLAKEKGKYTGRKKDPLPKNFERLYYRWKDGYITATELTKLLGYKSRSTTYKKINEFESGKELEV